MPIDTFPNPTLRRRRGPSDEWVPPGERPAADLPAGLAPQGFGARLRRLLARVREGGALLNVHLAAYYRLCGLEAWPAAIGEFQSVSLRPQELLRLTERSGVREIEVLRGTLWVTETPASDDLVLTRGRQLRCEGRWPIVLQALDEAEIVVQRRI